MWLLNTETLTLEDFVGSQIPKYAILSHTWTKEEVKFSEISLLSSKAKHGYRKIENTCRLAKQAGLQYAWVDTCCIDKSSSAELSEAINSMYRWYERATVCFVYLEDLLGEAGQEADLSHCRWFTRGWTLQELIAPRDVLFYDQIWNFLGSKSELVDHLSSITRISSEILLHQWQLSSISVARKFSWAAHRQTTRVEDIAYCLLGLFDVNMPLLYGEEWKAFRRLQSEIINTNLDLSIFAWKMSKNILNGHSWSSQRVLSTVLATSPLDFAESLYDKNHIASSQQDFSLTNIGIKTRTSLASDELKAASGYRYVLALGCHGSSGRPLGIRLRKCGPDQFLRDDPFEIIERDRFFYINAPREQYLLASLPYSLDSFFQVYGWPLVTNASLIGSRPHILKIQLPEEMNIHDAWPWGSYDDEDQASFVQTNTWWDCASLRLRIYFEFRGVRVSFDCMFFAVGWSRPEEAPKCSIVNYSPMIADLSDLQRELVEWEPDSDQMIDALENHNVPKASVATREIPGMACSTLVSFKLTLTQDHNICVNDFWSVEFSCEVFETRDLPKISNEKWSSDI